MSDASERKPFRTLLPSDPVRLPFNGSFEDVAFQADQDRVMSLPEHSEELTGDLTERLDGLRQQLRAVRRETEQLFQNMQTALRAAANPESGEGEVGPDQEDAYYAGLRDANKQVERLRQEIAATERELNLRVIGWCVLRIGVYAPVPSDDGKPYFAWGWPYEGPAPDPRNLTTLDSWPNIVLSWIANQGLGEVRAQLKNLFSGGL